MYLFDLSSESCDTPSSPLYILHMVMPLSWFIKYTVSFPILSEYRLADSVRFRIFLKSPLDNPETSDPILHSEMYKHQADSIYILSRYFCFAVLCQEEQGYP